MIGGTCDLCGPLPLGWTHAAETEARHHIRSERQRMRDGTLVTLEVRSSLDPFGTLFTARVLRAGDLFPLIEAAAPSLGSGVWIAETLAHNHVNPMTLTPNQQRNL